MIAGYLNTLCAFALVYLSILDLPVLKSHPWLLVAAGLSVVLLALWSRAGDAMKWFSTVIILFGCMLAGFGVWHLLAPLADLFVFWFVFWTGALVGVLALWSALYRPRRHPATA